jgi:Lon protease-like protein
MSINEPYDGPDDLPEVIPIFPLNGALLLPRGQLPLNIFEPRYLAMLDDALKSHRIIGMVQMSSDASEIAARPPLYRMGCAGRITAFEETGDGRYMITLTGIARYRIVQELSTVTPYRQARVDFTDFARDFDEEADGEDVDRAGVVGALRRFAEAHQLSVDWDGIDAAPSDLLVNALAMMSPFGSKEKQALLEAPDLKTRADVLIAIAEMELAREEAPSTLQ